VENYAYKTTVSMLKSKTMEFRTDGFLNTSEEPLEKCVSVVLQFVPVFEVR
jgi:hypothetical protein